jgi:hypothetical protein
MGWRGSEGDAPVEEEDYLNTSLRLAIGDDGTCQLFGLNARTDGAGLSGTRRAVGFLRARSSPPNLALCRCREPGQCSDTDPLRVLLLSMYSTEKDRSAGCCFLVTLADS